MFLFSQTKTSDLPFIWILIVHSLSIRVGLLVCRDQRSCNCEFWVMTAAVRCLQYLSEAVIFYDVLLKILMDSVIWWVLLCQRGVTLPVFLSAVWLQKEDADVPDASAGWFHPSQTCRSGGFLGPSLPAAADCQKAPSSPAQWHLYWEPEWNPEVSSCYCFVNFVKWFHKVCGRRACSTQWC